MEPSKNTATAAAAISGKEIPVPLPSVEATAGAALRISDLQHQLKENESQRTEVTSYINQQNIQVHRWQLRLQTLNERQTKLRTELDQIRGTSEPPAIGAGVTP